MSQENVEIVRAIYEHFGRGDFSWFADVADDFEFVTSPEMPDAGTYRGEAAQRWVESFEGHTVEITEITNARDKVFVAMLQRGRARGGRTVVERVWWSVVTLREGVVARCEVFPERAQALEAAGLRQ